MSKMEHRRRPRSRRGAFTLIELLIVIAIIALLVGIGGAAFSRGRAQARRAVMKTLITGLEMGVRQYRTDLGQYPPSSGNSPVWRWPSPGDPARASVPWGGAQWLAHSALGLGDRLSDGYDGPGFRVQLRGTVYGPYVDADRASTKPDAGGNYFVDDGDNPIHYYLLNPSTREYDETHDTLTQLPDVPLDINEYAKVGATGVNLPDFIICSRGQDGSWGDDADKNGDLEGLGDDYTNLSE